MQTPIIMLCGNKGTGKSLTSEMIKKNYNAICISNADPIKRMLKNMFQDSPFKLTDEMLWGSSDLRKTCITQSLTPNQIQAGMTQVFNFIKNSPMVDVWLAEVFPNPGNIDTKFSLISWFHQTERFVGQGYSLTVRHLTQSLGTEWGRKYRESMWVDMAIKTANQLLESNGELTYKSEKGLIRNFDPDLTPCDYVVIVDGRFRNEILSVRRINGIVMKIDSKDKEIDDRHQSELELTTIPNHFFDAIIVNDKTGGLANLEWTVNRTMDYFQRHTWVQKITDSVIREPE